MLKVFGYGNPALLPGLFLRDKNHAFPQKRHSAGTDKLSYLEAFLFKKLGEGFGRPKLNVPAIPKRGMVKIPFVGDAQKQILKVTVVRRAEYEITSRLENLTRKLRQAVGIKQVLNHFGGNNGIVI